MITKTWIWEKKTAKDFGVIPKRFPSIPFVCVRFGRDRFAACSAKQILYSSWSNPDPHQQQLKFDPAPSSDKEKGIDLQWDADKTLMVVTKNALLLIDADTDAVTERKSENAITAACWTGDGNIVCVLESGVVELIDREWNVLDRAALEKKPNCAACDGDVLYVGVEQRVEVYKIEGGHIEKAGGFVAHPRDVVAIQVLRDNILVSSEAETVMWSKDGYIPLLTLKNPSTSIVADPGAQLAVGIGKIDSEKLTMMLVKSGKKADVREEMNFVKVPQRGEVCADWLVQDDGSKVLAVGIDGALNDYQQLMFVRFAMT